MPDIFSVVADATRRDILTILLERSRHGTGPGGTASSVSEIVARLALSQPTVSKHLKVLRDAGLVSVREDGQHRYYSLQRGPLVELEDFVVPFLGTEAGSADPLALPDPLSAAASGLGRIAADASAQASRIGRQATALVSKLRERP